jgi:hypothetical protein
MLRTFLVALALVAAASVAQAGSVTYTDTVPQGLTDYSTTLNLPQFNPALGTLQSVEIIVSDTGSTDLSVTQTLNTTAHLTVLSTQLYVDLTGVTIPSINVEPELTGGVSYAPPGHAIGPFSTFDTGVLTLTPASQSQSFSTGLSPFIGLGDLYFDLETFTYTTTTYLGGNLNTSQTTIAGGPVEIIYDYNPPAPPVPEPGTLGLFGTGLLGLAGLLRHKFMKTL